MHRAINNNLPTALTNNFRRPSHRYELRSRATNPFISNDAITAPYQKWITCAGVEMWNQISNELQILPYPVFKRKMKKFLQEKVFDST